MKIAALAVGLSWLLAAIAPVVMAADGKGTFEAKCKVCHRIDGKGSDPMAKGMKVELKQLDLTDDTKGKPDADLVKVVTDGLGGKMPSFKGKLTEAEISEVVKYFKGL